MGEIGGTSLPFGEKDECGYKLDLKDWVGG